MTGYIIPCVDLHFGERGERGDSARPWCGGKGSTTIVVDAVGCEDCNLLEGFRSPGPAKRASEDARAAVLEREYRQRAEARP